MELFSPKGVFYAEFYDSGVLIRRDTFENTVQTEGKNVMLDAGLAGSAYTVTGPFMGLISLVGYVAISAGDTAAQINGSNGWTEAGSSNAPTYTAPRKTCAWAAAASGAKSLSAALGFSFTGSGTVKGAFIIFGSGATSTIGNTSGKLWSTGLFAGGDQAVTNTTVLNITYTISS